MKTLLLSGPVAILAVVVAAAAIACGQPSAIDDDLGVPARDSTQPGDDDVLATPASSSKSPQIEVDAAAGDAGPDARDGASAPAPALCGAASVIACFSFDNAVKDHGTHAFVPSVTNVTYSAGKDGTAVVLGPTSAIRFAPSALWNSPSITVDAWIRPTARANDMVVFDADQRYAMIVKDDGELRCSSAGGNADGGSIPLGVWTHVACVFGSGRVRVFTGGTLRDDESGGAGGSLGSGAAIGGDAPNGAHFIGAIDSLRIFKTARTAAEIARTAGGSPD